MTDLIKASLNVDVLGWVSAFEGALFDFSEEEQEEIAEIVQEFSTLYIDAFKAEGYDVDLQGQDNMNCWIDCDCEDSRKHIDYLWQAYIGHLSTNNLNARAKALGIPNF